MKWLLIAAGLIALVVVLVLVVGWSLPVAHISSGQVILRASPETVWTTIIDVDAYPSWRADVRRIERLPDRDGHPAWTEVGGSDRLPLHVERSEPPRLLVTRIGPGLPFGGTWTYEIAPAPEGCVVTITERGEIYNPVFRAMARFVFGYESTLAAYLDSLRKKVG